MILADLIQKPALVERVEQPEAHSFVKSGARHDVTKAQNISRGLKCLQDASRVHERLDQVARDAHICVSHYRTTVAMRNSVSRADARSVQYARSRNLRDGIGGSTVSVLGTADQFFRESSVYVLDFADSAPIPQVLAGSDRDERLVGASHFSAKQIRKLFPALPRSVHAVPTGPPLHTPTAEDQRSHQRLATANLNGHGVFTLEFGQLD
jgi:hypothetical protein